MTTYVYDGIEVRKTGRTASKESPTLRGKRFVTLIEITPVGDDVGWKKWVDENSLYVVEENKENNENN
jgi:hypothetical protein